MGKTKCDENKHVVNNILSDIRTATKHLSKTVKNDMDLFECITNKCIDNLELNVDNLQDALDDLKTTNTDIIDSIWESPTDSTESCDNNGDNVGNDSKC